MGMCKECGGVFSATEMENGVCKSCRNSSAQERKQEGSTKKIEIDNTNSTSNNNFEFNQKVIVTDIKMPFWSMVIFMVKWVIASIPAFIILFILANIFIGVIGGLGNVVAPQPSYGY